MDGWTGGRVAFNVGTNKMAGGGIHALVLPLLPTLHGLMIPFWWFKKKIGYISYRDCTQIQDSLRTNIPFSGWALFLGRTHYMAGGCSSSQSDSLLHASIVFLRDLVITVTHQRTSPTTFQSFKSKHEILMKSFTGLRNNNVIFGGKY